MAFQTALLPATAEAWPSVANSLKASWTGITTRRQGQALFSASATVTYPQRRAL